MKKKPYERAIQRPMGDKTILKKKVEHMPYCEKCESYIRGNGSGLLPYYCNCRIYKYHSSRGEWESRVPEVTNTKPA